MNEKQIKSLLFMKTMTGFGLLVGLAVFVYSFFESGIKQDYILSIGLSIMASSMLLFGFGLFLNLMEEVTSKRHLVK